MEKIISLVIAIIYLVLAYINEGGELVLRVGLFLLLPLACIWLSEEMGRFTGRVFLDFPRRRVITSESPTLLVKFTGWVLLLLPLIMGLIIFLILS